MPRKDGGPRFPAEVDGGWTLVPPEEAGPAGGARQEPSAPNTAAPTKAHAAQQEPSVVDVLTAKLMCCLLCCLAYANKMGAAVTQAVRRAGEASARLAHMVGSAVHPLAASILTRQQSAPSTPLGSSSPAMAEHPQGVEFLLRRLQRAAAIPAAERPPDVAAFVESVQLLREACDLLPVTSDGSPALRLGIAEVRQQASLALLKVVRADYICPFYPVSDRQVITHLQAWCGGMRGANCDDLAALLDRCVLLKYAGNGSFGLVCRAAATMLEQLADPATQQAISGQLSQLAAAYPGQPLLSFNQLHYTCCCNAVHIVRGVRGKPPTGSQLQAGGTEHSAALAHHAEAASMATLAAATILRLEPDNPKSYDIAAAAEVLVAPGMGPAAVPHRLRSTELLMQGAQLARQQGSTFFTARCAAGAASHASAFARTHRSSWQAAVTAFEGAEAAVRECKRFLPALWVGAMEAEMQLAQQAVELVQRQLRTQHSAGSADAEVAAIRSVTQTAVAGLQRLGRCDGCGQEAVGLRRCARCKTAQYCSTKCQRKHWSMHKRECHEA